MGKKLISELGLNYHIQAKNATTNDSKTKKMDELRNKQDMKNTLRTASHNLSFSSLSSLSLSSCSLFSSSSLSLASSRAKHKGKTIILEGLLYHYHRNIMTFLSRVCSSDRRLVTRYNFCLQLLYAICLRHRYKMATTVI